MLEVPGRDRAHRDHRSRPGQLFNALRVERGADGNRNLSCAVCQLPLSAPADTPDSFAISDCCSAT